MLSSATLVRIKQFLAIEVSIPLKKKIRKVLSALLDNDVAKVLTLLKHELGVDDVENLQHLVDGDLTTVLKPVQARKL